MIEIKDTVAGIDLSINDKNAKLTSGQKLVKIMKCLNLKARKIIIKNGKQDLPAIKRPYHVITLYVDVTKFDRAEFAKKLGLTEYHIHINDQVITKNGFIDVVKYKEETGKVSKYSSISVII